MIASEAGEIPAEISGALGPNAATVNPTSRLRTVTMRIFGKYVLRYTQAGEANPKKKLAFFEVIERNQIYFWTAKRQICQAATK